MTPSIPSPISLTPRRPCGTLRYYVQDSNTRKTFAALLGHPTLSPKEVEALKALGMRFVEVSEDEGVAGESEKSRESA